MRDERTVVIALVAVVVLSVAGFGLAKARPARSDDTGLISSPDGSYEYGIIREPGKSAEVMANSPQSTKESERYRAANVRRAKSLVESGHAGRLRASITFAESISLAETQALLDGARVEEVESCTMVGYDAQGQKAGSTAFGPCPSTMEEITELAPDVSIVGILGVTGYVRGTPDGLGRSLDDPRVYMADVTEFQIRELARTKRPNWVCFLFPSGISGSRVLYPGRV